MNQLLDFLLKNWIWVAALVAIIIWIIIEETRSTVRGVRKISPQEATRLINREQAMVLDIRDQASYAAGHVIGSVQILPADLESKATKLVKQKDKPIIMVCNMGQQSIVAGAKLKSLGFEQVYSLTGGISAWRQANLPVAKLGKESSKKIEKKNESKTRGQS